MKKRPGVALGGHKAEFCRLARENARRHSLFHVFRDFCELAALAISNATDRVNFDKREGRYMQIVRAYERDEVQRFAQMLACVVEELEAGMTDCMGELFMALELGDAGKGQFFTPFSVSSLMARLTLGDLRPHIERAGFVSFNEPAVGAGGMVIAAADAMREAGINYQQTMHVVATDIDATACHMAYIQFSLLHIPAVVIHGNGLNPAESWDEGLTPAHILGGWSARLRGEGARARAAELVMPAANPVPAAVPVIASPREAVAVIERRREAQMALF